MSSENVPAGHPSPDRDRLLQACRDKSRCEIEAAEEQHPLGIDSRGDVLADVLLFKGVAGPAEEAGGPGVWGG